MRFDMGTEEQTGGDEIPAGTYFFKVDEVAEKTFKTGSQGVSIKLLVMIGSKDITVYDNLVATEKARWKWQQLAKALGLPTKGEIDPHQFLNRMGVADFERKADSKYLQVGRYTPPAETPTREVLMAGASAPAVAAGDDDVPF